MDREETNTMRLKRVLIIFLSILNCRFSIGYAEHLFEAGVHGGLSGWSAQPIYVSKQLGFNGGAQLYYNYLSPRVIGFRTGLSLDCHTAGFGKTNYEDHYTAIDVENQRMEIDYTIGKLSERYTLWSVGLPLQLALSKKDILFLIGARAVFPLTNSWKQTVNSAALSVYYPDYDNRIYESYPLAASRDFAMTNTGKLNLPKVQWWFATELNYIIPLNNRSRTHRSYIIVGAYFDYCFSKHSPTHSDAESLIMLTDTRDGFPLQRILTPIMEANRQNRQLINQCAFFDVGLKISYAISPYNASRHSSSSCHCLPVW